MTAAKTAAPTTILSGHCGVGGHTRCRGSYGGYPCRCDCHTSPAEPDPEVLGEIAAVLTDLGTAAAVELAVTAPPFPYFGGKTRLAERIVSLLPEHQHYVEPFAGSLAVLLAKPRAAMETVNDLDGDLMTFWRVLRDRPEDLARVCVLTPHAREEHQASYDLPVDLDEVERARRVWVRLSQGRNGTMRRTGWRFYEKPRGGMSMPGYLASYVDRFGPCVERLAGVSLECRPALDLIRAYGEHEGVLLYCDPPYLASTRGWGNNYAHELRTDNEHRELAEALTGCAAAVVLSGYHSPLYDELYDSWHRAEIKAWTGNGIRNGATKTDGDRVEVLWSNRPFPAAVPSLFDEVPA